MRYQAIVFDLDGTLLNTLEDLYLATNHALAEFDLPPRTREEVRSYVGNGYRNLVRLAVTDGTPDIVQEQILDCFNSYYLAHSQDHTVPYEGIPELLERLKGRGIPLAVISNKGDAAVRHLMDVCFPHTFAAVAGEKKDVRRKPAPDTLLAAAAQLGLDPKDLVLVGDSEVDVATARNAGCDCIAVTWGFRSIGELREAGAQRMASDCDELEELLLQD